MVSRWWVVSFLKHRFQSVQISSIRTNPIELLFPRVWCLDRSCLLCIPLSSVLSKPRISITTYMQMKHRSITPSTHPVLKNLRYSLVSVQDWMYKNKFKLNHDKTEFLLIGNKCHRQIFPSSFPIDILGNQISLTPTARNQGVIFDSDFNFIPHINSIIKSCNYHMRQFRRIRKQIDRVAACKITNFEI